MSLNINIIKKIKSSPKTGSFYAQLTYELTRAAMEAWFAIET